MKDRLAALESAGKVMGVIDDEQGQVMPLTNGFRVQHRVLHGADLPHIGCMR